MPDLIHQLQAAAERANKLDEETYLETGCVSHTKIEILRGGIFIHVWDNREDDYHIHLCQWETFRNNPHCLIREAERLHSDFRRQLHPGEDNLEGR